MCKPAQLATPRILPRPLAPPNPLTSPAALPLRYTSVLTAAQRHNATTAPADPETPKKAKSKTTTKRSSAAASTTTTATATPAPAPTKLAKVKTVTTAQTKPTRLPRTKAATSPTAPGRGSDTDSDDAVPLQSFHPTPPSSLRSSAATTSTPISVAASIYRQAEARRRAENKNKGGGAGSGELGLDYEEDEAGFDAHDPRQTEMGRGARRVGSKASHTSKFDPQGLGISNDFCPQDHATRDGALIDIVKRKQLQQINHADTVAMELTRKEFERRTQFVLDEKLTSALEPVVTAEDLAILSMSPDKLVTNRQFDITRGSPYSEHIRHLFPVDDFSGDIPALTDSEIRAMFNRRPRFLNFVTENNPHGFDVTVLHRLAAQTNLARRSTQIKQQISHRYWHLRCAHTPKSQPKISHRMHVHRTLNPRSNTFKHHYLKPRQQKTKQQIAEEKSGFNVDSGEPNILADFDQSLYNDIKWSQDAIMHKLRQAGLTPEQVEQTRRFALTDGEGFLGALADNIGRDKLDPTLKKLLEIRSEAMSKEDLNTRRERLADVFVGFVANLDNPGRFSKVLISAEQDSGKLIVNAEFRKQLVDEVNRMGGLSDLKQAQSLEKILNIAMVDPAKAKKRAKAASASKKATRDAADKLQRATIEDE